MTETIVAMAVATFLTRAAGVMGAPVRGRWAVRAITLVPVAAFAALVSSSLEVRADAWLRWVVVGIGGWLAWRGAQVWVCVGGGLALYVIGASLFR